MRIGVYCASSDEIQSKHFDMARATGAWIGAHGHSLIWGGCRLGLMQCVGEAVQQAGGRVVAVLPRFLAERELAFETADECVVTETMAARKQHMRENADVFVALSGGVGTWDEVIELLALKKLKRVPAPIVIANVAGYYDPLLEMIDRSVQAGFSPSGLARLFDVASDPDEMCRALTAAVDGIGPQA